MTPSDDKAPACPDPICEAMHRADKRYLSQIANGAKR